MPRPLLPTVAKAAAGFLLGLGLWAGFGSVYSRFVAAGAQPLLRMMERPAVTRLVPEGTTIIVNRDDFPRNSPRPQLPVNDLTFNVILLAALYASNRAPLSTSNVVRFLGAALLLSLTHVLAFVATVESVYALQLGLWSQVHYGPLARNAWAGAAHFYRLAGIYGIAFLLWWPLRPQPAADAARPRDRRPRRKRTSR